MSQTEEADPTVTAEGGKGEAASAGPDPSGRALPLPELRSDAINVTRQGQQADTLTLQLPAWVPHSEFAQAMQKTQEMRGRIRAAVDGDEAVRAARDRLAKLREQEKTARTRHQQATYEADFLAAKCRDLLASNDWTDASQAAAEKARDEQAIVRDRIGARLTELPALIRAAEQAADDTAERVAALMRADLEREYRGRWNKLLTPLLERFRLDAAELFGLRVAMDELAFLSRTARRV